MRRTFIISVLVIAVSAPASAQFVVHDAAVTFRNTLTATLKELLLWLQRDQHSQLRRMAQRLSLHTTLTKYAVPDPPKWRTHGGDDFLFAHTYTDALNFGDTSGAAYTNLTHPLVASRAALDRLGAAARRAMANRLATIEITDAATIAAAHDTGQLRLNGRKEELPAIDALEAHVIDPSNEQSATAVLDKISGAVLIGARQRQARVQLLAGVVEQLLVDSKRARDAEATAINMQLTTWRDAEAANKAFRLGSGDALRAWRQP
jgi:3-dehydroquinate synthetase